VGGYLRRVASFQKPDARLVAGDVRRRVEIETAS
jgi:hypothetical protein